MDNSVTDPAGITAIKDALYGGFCLTEATEEGDWDGVTALTEDDDGATICAVAGGEAEWGNGFTQSFDKAEWDVVKADTTGTDTAQLDSSLTNDVTSVAGITEFVLESRTDSNPYQYYQVWFKSQRIECPEDTDLDVNADFALRTGQPFILSLVDSNQADNASRIQYVVDAKVHGSWVEETVCVEDDDDDFAVSSMVQATTALFLSFLALTSF